MCLGIAFFPPYHDDFSFKSMTCDQPILSVILLRFMLPICGLLNDIVSVSN